MNINALDINIDIKRNIYYLSIISLEIGRWHGDLFYIGKFGDMWEFDFLFLRTLYDKWISGV